eukprot:CAMPEP_0198253172 /NCGR_PEP_ID=MMETSP1447-20131203/3617_1 /TAXON_ID=420782 /ORGANISM="Chaetoceros dichaeta, Strain CCMP1751" /LENGTH=328 /DNA_ID=CAMNT_0043938719 /DNA_START=1 /DNA_END=987 /DNA_ORIENTATION=+
MLILASSNSIAFHPPVASSRTSSSHQPNRYLSSNNNNDNDNNNNNTPNKPPTPNYKSRSTANPEPTTPYATNTNERRSKLESALTSLGINTNQLTTSPEYRGTAALRSYTSFLLPKSQGAFAIAESPQRAVVVANNISFLLREHKSHQQEWLRNHDRSLAEVNDLFKDQPHQRTPLILILDNIRSAHNVGNILRAAEAARVTNVFLCGITPTPPNPKVLKTALSSAAYVPHQHVGSTMEVVRELQGKGVAVWGVETTSNSQSLWTMEMTQPLALVFGNEVVGVHADVLEECDGLVSVPMLGVKNSLNVATCASIVMWEALRQWEVEGV